MLPKSNFRILTMPVNYPSFVRNVIFLFVCFILDSSQINFNSELGQGQKFQVSGKNNPSSHDMKIDL